MTCVGSSSPLLSPTSQRSLRMSNRPQKSVPSSSKKRAAPATPEPPPDYWSDFRGDDFGPLIALFDVDTFNETPDEDVFSLLMSLLICAVSFYAAGRRLTGSFRPIEILPRLVSSSSGRF